MLASLGHAMPTPADPDRYRTESESTHILSDPRRVSGVTRMIRLCRPGRVTASLLLFALGVSVVFAVLASTSNLNAFPRFLKPALIPGIFCLYIVGTITGSLAAGGFAFAAGMAIVYGVTGLAVDASLRLRQLLKRSNKAT